MSTVQAIKQLEERNVASEIVQMVWSDRMDLVALANIKGEVALHRLTWTKAWSLSAPKDGLKVTSIAWRPDGKIIAIAYSSGQILLVKVENKSVLHTIDIKGEVSCLNWLQDRTVKGKLPSVDEDSKQNQYMKHIDLSGNFLPEPVLQQFDSPNNDDGQKTNILQEQTDFNLLLIGTSEGTVHVRVFGCFPCASLDLKQTLNCFCSIQNMHLNEDLNRMFFTVRDNENNVKLICFDSEIFKTHTNELFALALKHIKLTSLVTYLSNTITTITESWESILLEMDNKLSKYASKVPEGGVTADFLDLLTFGICSDEMKTFLIHDLTKKGLEKFGQTIEMSYSNIQKLMLKYVMKFGQNVTYHLAEMRGMARLEHRYKVLGLDAAAITGAISSNGAFLIKGSEMQQIINHSIINYKAFFRWLYTAIMHVLDEPIPNEIPKMTQQDLAYITEFLQNFDHISRNNKQKGFIMERLGQYLSDGNLTIQPDMSGNEWTDFLAQNQCMEKNSSILRHFKEMSLIQQYKHLKQSVDAIFATPREQISRQFSHLNDFNCFQFCGDSLRTSQVNLNKESILFCYLQPPETVLGLQVYLDDGNCFIKCARLYFPRDNSEDNYHVIDIKLYSSAVLSVLLQENTVSKATVLSQIPIGGVLDKFVDGGETDRVFSGGVNVVSLNGSCLVPKLFKCVEGMVGAEFAVSGSRRVGIVLAENRRKVRLYEMEGEEEEEEDAEMNNSGVQE
ncbi:Anaphase-promoting complex subunit 4-like Protein [Tribolium castaneum]|uniref:Anaphase-promoting complex subunit 4 n=1 Tax=Tribolium castaneum TaxID=7070 RepID=D6X523_TRICA|nr:PREDICTED: anaphase-promoting complex subunit 4 [Tribolium castaneum]EEZ97189.1 Anaphase-promoting complex subunit 4-like Protein [Tribolium castaneum]|eukprot:XP_970702.1 PREDICTED: anaphase-promoting complex subunit 4 [Tribolium castaneum]